MVRYQGFRGKGFLNPYHLDGAWHRRLQWWQVVGTLGTSKLRGSRPLCRFHLGVSDTTTLTLPLPYPASPCPVPPSYLAMLQRPAQRNLRRSLAMRPSNCEHGGVVQHRVPRALHPQTSSKQSGGEASGNAGRPCMSMCIRPAGSSSKSWLRLLVKKPGRPNRWRVMGGTHSGFNSHACTQSMWHHGAINARLPCSPPRPCPPVPALPTRAAITLPACIPHPAPASASATALPGCCKLGTGCCAACKRPEAPSPGGAGLQPIQAGRRVG